MTWSAVGVGLKLLRLLATDGSLARRDLLGEHLVPAALYGLGYGAALGTGFALLLLAVGRKARSSRDLSMASVGVAGAIAGCGLHWWVIGGPAVDPLVISSIALGAGCGTGSLALARHADRLSAGPERSELPAG